MAPKKAKSKSNASPAPDPAPTSNSKKGPKKNIVKSGNAGSNGKRDANIDQEPSEKKSIFGDWTGKTPVSLLHEHCQKQGWEKPTFDMSRIKNGFIGTVQLGKRNKKTAQIQTLPLRPPNECALPTALEARHLAATFALHRVNSHMPMHRVLPPQFRDYWHQFETYKTKDNAWQYAPDPFSAQPPQTQASAATDKRPVKEHASAAVPLPQQQQQKNSSNGNATTQGAPCARPKAIDEKLLKYWESLPVVHMSTGNRELVEQVIKNSNVIYQKRTEEIPAEELQEIKEGLVDMGFRPSHVEEAMEYCDSTASALDWLCLHVPEDDLPPTFMHAGYNPTMTTISHTTQSLGRDWTIKKLTTIGYSVKICQEAMEQTNDNDLKALELMQWRLVHGSQEMPEELLSLDEDVDASELKTTRQEEVIALESIYGSRFQKISESDDRQHYSIRISSSRQQVASDIVLEIIVPTQSKYPHTVPIFAVQCQELPAYIKLSIIKGIVAEAENNLGMPMIYMCAEWLQENVDEMIANPPKLREVTEGIANLVTLPSAKPDTKKRTKSQSEQKKRGTAKELKEAMQRLHASDEYAPFKTSRASLPADKFKNEILEAVSKNQITIVSGETGCGKTTQVPQFILDQEIELERGEDCNIICTQPRKVAAIGVAERVAAERCESIGKSVGYAVRGETKASAYTRLQFVTTGVLLRRLQSDPNLDGVSHVLVDEVHERSVDSDFLLILLKRLLEKRKDLKVVLMSATINQQLFSEYFGGAPCIEIPGFTHPVQDFYLEDIVRMTSFVSRMPTPKRDREDKEGSGEWAQWQIKLLEAGFDEQTVRTLSRYRNQLSIDYDLVAHTVKHIVTRDALKLENGAQPAILIFVPGAMEIRRCIDTMQSVLGRSEEYEILPLHANLSPQEQRRVFKKVPHNVFKIVVATNVAETSITIDGVVYVIDCGRVKETQYDTTTNMMHLVETWASRASCKQRRGRAGRTRPGQCYKLFMRDTEANQMSAQQMPEILRTPLEQLCLQVKAMGEQDVRAFLSKAIDPPSTKALEHAIHTLQAVEAIQDGKSGQLTPLGKHMASIPADLRISKMLLLGSIFRCLEPVLTIAAIMSLKSPFTSPMDKREEARQCRERFALGKSDWLTDMKAFEKWQHIRETKGMREARHFCEENFLSLPTLLEIQSLRRQYADTLVDIGFYHHGAQSDHFNVNSDNLNLIKSIIFGGLNPNVAKIKMPETKYDKVLAGTVEREKDAREIKYYVKDEGRVFLHPSSILFNNNSYNSLFLTYFSRMTTSKTFIRDGTEVPAYAILFFGGKVDVDHFGRGLKVGQDGWIRLRAWARIGVLVNQLKRLLLAELDIKIQDPSVDVSSSKVVQTMIALISSDGL